MPAGSGQAVVPRTFEHRSVYEAEAGGPARCTRDWSDFEEGCMKAGQKADRRSFLGGMAGAVAAASLPIAGARIAAAAEQGHDDWLAAVKGGHRSLFSLPDTNTGSRL